MFFTSSNFSTSHSSTGLLSSNSDCESSLLSDNSNNSTSPLFCNDSPSFDVGSIGGKDILFGNPDLSNLDSSFVSYAPQTETAGSIAFGGTETAGSVAFSGAETAGSVACGGGCGDGGFSSFC